MSITLRKETLQKYMNLWFVETGTFKGGGVRLALECGFPRVVSIEIDPLLHNCAWNEFANNGNVSILLGDSIKILPEVAKTTAEPITFWLDAHIQESAVIGQFPVPLIQELKILAEHRKGFLDTVMVDDCRLFGKGGYWQNTKREDIIKILQEAYPHNTIVYEDSNAGAADILVCYYKPENLEQFIVESQDNPAYAQ